MTGNTNARSNFAGGVHNYSTEEQVVGTWQNADGTRQPLYEKTVYLPRITGTDRDVLIFNMSSISNSVLTSITDFGFYNTSTMVYQPYSLNYQARENNTTIWYFVYGTTEIRMYKGSTDWWRNWSVRMTIQYIKTTDTPI